jgi:preprotein translocase subunit SecE
MAFHEVRFPDNISRGARGGPERRTQVVELASGDEERNASWANSRRRYDVAYGIRRADDLAAVVAFYMLGKQDLWLRVVALLVLVAAAVATFFTSEHGKQLIAFGRDSVREVKKVVWPARNEALQMTGYVFAFVFVMALFMWLTDKTLEWVLYDLVLGWRR